MNYVQHARAGIEKPGGKLADIVSELIKQYYLAPLKEH